ncbi:MAG: hypothetical protein ABI910_21815 [Gemmatimonadota bacterium]
MTRDAELEKLAPANGGEMIALEIAWARGALDCHVERILAFVDRNRDDIMQLADDAAHETSASPDPRAASPHPSDAHALLDAVKRVVGRAGAVHLPSEMRDQLQVMRDELWIRGERGDYDRANIAQEWTSLHAANWRRWRLKEYAFVIDRSTDPILARLGAGSRAAGDRRGE